MQRAAYAVCQRDLKRDAINSILTHKYYFEAVTNCKKKKKRNENIKERYLSTESNSPEEKENETEVTTKKA